MTPLEEAAALNALAQQAATNATSALNIIFGLAGDYGRYASLTSNPAITSETEAIAAATVARAATMAAGANLLVIVQSSGDVPFAAQALIDAVLACASAPADRMQACAHLAGTVGTGQVAILCRRLAVIALANAASAYEPTSYEDAQGVLGKVADALDAEITAAGDVGDDGAFKALRTLRVDAASDLAARGATLAPLRTVTFGASLPHFVVAAMLYGDAAREDELVRRVDPVHPLFMPAVLQVLAS